MCNFRHRTALRHACRGDEWKMDKAARSNATLASSIARTASSYENLPYRSRAFPQTHPGRLSAIATMFGLETPPVETARVLELGCASGGNLIPHAARFPDGQFVGVDLSPGHVELARERIADLGLGNIEIRCQSITDL